MSGKHVLITGASQRHRPRAGAAPCARRRAALAVRARRSAARSRRESLPRQGRRCRDFRRRRAEPRRHGEGRGGRAGARAARYRRRQRRRRDRPLHRAKSWKTPEAVRATLAINVIGVLNTVEPAISAMTKRGSGAIAIVGSMAGVRGLPFSPAYCASKAAVYSYAESLRGRAGAAWRRCLHDRPGLRRDADGGGARKAGSPAKSPTRRRRTSSRAGWSAASR